MARRAPTGAHLPAHLPTSACRPAARAPAPPGTTTGRSPRGNGPSARCSSRFNRPPPRSSIGSRRPPGQLLGSERGGLLGHRRLLVGGVVLVDDALADGLVQLGGGNLQRVLDRGLVAGLGGGTELADPGAELALDRLVALGALGVGLDPLDLGLDGCHEGSFSRLCRPVVPLTEGVSTARDRAWGYPWLNRSGSNCIRTRPERARDGQI